MGLAFIIVVLLVVLLVVFTVGLIISGTGLMARWMTMSHREKQQVADQHQQNIAETEDKRKPATDGDIGRRVG